MNALVTRALVVVVSAALAGAACGVENVSVPGPTGPSELGLSLELTLSKDVISQDGVSTARLDILARGANGLPLGGVPLRVDMMVPTADGPVVADYGSLSDRWPTTASDGRASVTYQAPPQPAPTVTTDTKVTLRVTPIGNNYAGSVPRVIDVLLVRPGTIQPPTRMVPRFTYSPSNPREHDDIFFDASTSSDPDGHIVSYTWYWGDGTTGSGKQDSHSFDVAGTYNVILSVSDSFGRSVSTTPLALTVGSSPLPTARFSVSPTDAGVGQSIGFNAVASTASAGRRIVSYSWDMGDGTFKEGVAVTHAYQSLGNFTVILVVTDDAGRQGISTQTITIGDLANPTASFTVSPTDPKPGTTVNFNASASTAPFGRTIVSYDWNFGDGGTASGVNASHVFAAEGTFTVTLTVTDSTGRRGIRSVTLNVKF